MLLEEVWNSSYSDILAVLAAPPPPVMDSAE